MHCINCGTNLEENDKFCPKCGTPVQKLEVNNTNIKNEGMNYNYERPMNQQSNEQNYGQFNTYSNQYGNEKSSGRKVKVYVIIIIIVVIVAVIGLGAYLLTKSILNKNDNKSVPSEISSQSESSENSSSVSQVANTQKSSTYKVNYEGFNIYIPDNLIYEYNDTKDAINISDTASSWVAKLNIRRIFISTAKTE